MNRNEVLDRAKEVVNGQRQQDYGNPENNLGIIAELWSDYLGMIVDTVDVSMLMILLKIARIRSGHATEDSFVDICGYGSIGAEMKSRLSE